MVPELGLPGLCLPFVDDRLRGRRHSQIERPLGEIRDEVFAFLPAYGAWSRQQTRRSIIIGSSKRRIGNIFAPPTRALSSLYSFATSEKFSPASSLALASSERESFSHKMCRTLICWKDFCFEASVVVLPLAGEDAAASGFAFLPPPFAPMIAFEMIGLTDVVTQTRGS